MKKIIKILWAILLAGMVAGLTSCAIFDESSHAQKQKPFKHSKPLPKKWVIDNGSNPVLK